MSKHGRAIALAGLLFFGFDCAAPAASDTGGFADSPFIVDVWGTGSGEQKLPQSVVLSIVQSRQGYLWLGTLNGLVRFDGTRFVVFDEANLPGLSSRRIVCLFEDSRTNLWVGTEAEGIVLVGRDGSTRRFNIGLDNFAGKLIQASEHSSGTVCLNTADGEVARYRNDLLEVLGVKARPAVTEKSGPLWLGLRTHLFAVPVTANASAVPVEHEVPVRTLEFLLPGRTGGCWRLVDGRVQKWTAGQLEHDWGDYPWGTNTLVTAACEDSEGNLIVGTQNAGAFWFDSRGTATQISSPQGLSHTTVLSLCMGREGDLWVGTDGGGLNRVKRKLFRVLEGSDGRTIQSTCEDGRGGLWFANYFDGKLSHWKGGVLTLYDQQQGLMDPNLRCVFVDRDQRVWVGTTLGGLFVLEGNTFRLELGRPGQINPSISAIYQDRTNRLWVGTARSLLCLDGRTWTTYTTRDGLTANDVRAIAEDAAGDIWVGTQHGGLNCFRGGKITSFRKSDDGLPSDNVSALCVDAEGVLWIGTSAGLARFHNGKWTRYTTRRGLASNGIGYLIEDGQGSLWIGSYAGLMRLSKKSLNDFALGLSDSINCRVYGISDGLPTPECAQGSQPAACRTPDGRLWFATIRGLVSVNPSELKPNLFQPPVSIESVLVEGRSQFTNDFFAENFAQVVVPPGEERLEIRYTSLNLGAADRAQFKFLLEGHETRWNEVGNTRVARYSNLPQGHYRFLVRACNEDGVWSEAASSLAITVLPPFWRTWWFLSIVAACLIGWIVGTVYFLSTQKLHRQLAGMRQQEALEKERARIARDLHDQLGANLTQVALLGELAESDKQVPAEVESHARQISHTARETTRALDEIVWAVNPSNDTLESLISYVCKYAQEYFELAQLRYRVDVPTQLPGATMPPEVRHNVFLAAKEAINNIVKHAQASAAWIRLRLEPDRFTLEFEDNGRGLAAMDEKTGRNGLRNMRKRMEDVGGSFSISPAPAQGAVVRLTVPIAK